MTPARRVPATDVSATEVPPPETPVLEVEAMTVAHGPTVVVDEVSLAVRPGEVVALIGPNGAGKSSLLEAVAGTVATRGGEVRIDGRDVSRRGARGRRRAGIARTHQTPAVLGPSALAEVALAAGTRGRGPAALRRALTPPSDDDRARAHGALRRLGLGDERAHLPSAELGLADQRRLELARALVQRPIVLLLDEPASGMTPEERRALASVIAALPTPGLGVLVVEHDMDLVASVADRVLALDQGRLVVDGTFAEVTAHPDVRRAYLGVPGGSTELVGGAP